MPKGSPGRTITYEGDVVAHGEAVPRELLLGSLEAINRIAAEAESIHAGLSRALKIICGALGWPIGHVYQRAIGAAPALVSAELWHLDRPEQFGSIQELTRHTTFRPGEGLVGQVLAQQRPWLSPDVSKDRRFLRRQAARADGVHAWLAFPVFVDGNVIAVCECFSTERGTIDSSLLGLLTCAGVALGRLYERERWRAERAALLHQLAAGGETTVAQERAALAALAGAIAHEVNSPLFSARTTLALLTGTPEDQALIAAARGDLARVAAVMESLQALAQEAPIGQRLGAIIAQPAA